MALCIVHHPDFQAKIAPGHRFPMGKYGLIAKYLVEDGLIPFDGFHVPEEAGFDTVTTAHCPHYAKQVFTGEVDPKISREIGFDINSSVARRARLSSAATLLAARLSIEHSIATSSAGGSHHARREQGAGFCVFNDVAIAASEMLRTGEIGNALIVDCDVHQGDGTASIFRNEKRVQTVSIHSEKNYPVRKPPSDMDIGLPDGVNDAEYLRILQETLPKAVCLIHPDIVFYNAGVDTHAEDRLGRLAMSDAGIAERDRLVIGFFREKGIPIVCVQGGGYSNDVESIARRHTIIHHVASEFV